MKLGCCCLRVSTPRSEVELDPHRHEDVERALVAVVLDHGRRARIGQLEMRRLALELASDVEQIASVEADLERRRIVIDADLLGSAAALRVVDREQSLSA